METADLAYMEQALKLAFAGMGTTSPNPSVGAVLVRDGEVLSTGSTSSSGMGLGGHLSSNRPRKVQRFRDWSFTAAEYRLKAS